MALELNDPRIRETYQKIRAAELDWCVLGYGGTRNVVTYESSGTGIDNMVKALTGPANYAYVRYPNTNKFILCVYLTPEAGSVMKAKVAVHKSSISEHFHFVHVMIQSANAQDFVEEKLKKAIDDGPLDRPKDDLDPSVVVTFDNGTPAPVRASRSERLKEEAKPEPVKEEPKEEANPEPVPEPEPVKEEPKPETVPEPEPEPVKEEPKEEAKPEPVPEPEPVKEEPKEEAKPEPVPEPEPVKEEPVPEPEPVKEELKEEPVKEEPVKEEPKPEPVPEPEPVKEEPKPEPVPEPEPEPVKEEPKEESKPEPVPEPEPEPVKEEPKPEPVKEEKKPEPVKQETYKPAAFVPSSTSAKTDEDELLEQLTEEELNKLLSEADMKTSEKPKPKPIAMPVFADDPEKEARRKKAMEEFDSLTSKLGQNSKEVPVVLNLTSHEFLGEDCLDRLGTALANNTVVTELILANVNMTSNGCVFLIEALKPNTTIVHINLESNAIGGEGFEAIADFLNNNNILKELRLTNQRTTLAGKSEKVFVKAVEQNTSLQKLGVTSKDQTTRNQLDKYIFRNKDLARQKRVAEQKAKK